jgi:hypothetical protein
MADDRRFVNGNLTFRKIGWGSRRLVSDEPPFRFRFHRLQAFFCLSKCEATASHGLRLRVFRATRAKSAGVLSCSRSRNFKVGALGDQWFGSGKIAVPCRGTQQPSVHARHSEEQKEFRDLHSSFHHLWFRKWHRGFVLLCLIPPTERRLAGVYSRSRPCKANRLETKFQGQLNLPRVINSTRRSVQRVRRAFPVG